MTTRVGHCRRDKVDVYIGRGSKWGNPFVFPGTKSKHPVTESDDPLNDYEHHVRRSPQLMNALGELKGKVLGCWCVTLDNPDAKPCHGHVLAKLAEEYGDG